MIRLSLLMLAFGLFMSAIGQSPQQDEKAIREINQAYVSAWLAGDEHGVLSLFEEGGSITPGGAGYFEGHEEIRSFWFPNDGSVTTIEEFTNEIVYLTHEDDVIVSCSNSILSWSWQLGEDRLAQDQEGYALTFYRRQDDGSWKIWKQIWSDVWSVDRN